MPFGARSARASRRSFANSIGTRGGLGLFGAELVAIDGTFLKAVNHPARNFPKAKGERVLQEIDERTEASWATLEKAEAEAASQGLGDAGGAPAPAQEGTPLRERVAQWPQDRQEDAALLARLTAEPGTQLSWTDPDRRLLQKRDGNGGRVQRAGGRRRDPSPQSPPRKSRATRTTRSSWRRWRRRPARRSAWSRSRRSATPVFSNIAPLVRGAAHGLETYVPAPQPARVAGDGSYPDTRFRD
jgi:hypothetical protein